MELGVFQNASLSIAIIVLLICLVILALILMKTTNSTPPIIDSCPDYWTTSNYLNPVDTGCKTSEFGCCSDYATAKTDADGTNCPIKCYNAHKLGTTSSSCTAIPTEMDFGTDVYTGSSALCNKQKWAEQCGITWDGVTNVSTGC